MIFMILFGILIYLSFLISGYCIVKHAVLNAGRELMNEIRIAELEKQRKAELIEKQQRN